MRKNSFWSFALEGPRPNHSLMCQYDTHFFSIAYELWEFAGAPQTDPITADLTASSGMVAKAPSTWKSH